MTAPKAVVLAVVLTLVAAGVPLDAEAQQAGRTPRIGALVVAAPGFPPVEGFRQGLRELGYVEGRNITVEYRYAQGKADRYGDLPLGSRALNMQTHWAVWYYEAFGYWTSVNSALTTWAIIAGL